MNWDRWRASYPTTTFEREQAFCAEVAKKYPQQRHFDPGRVLSSLVEADARDVDEVGGWDGELAACLLPLLGEVRVWRNHELCPNLSPVCADPRYTHVVLADWPWTQPLTGDALALSHVVEHMSHAQFRALLAASAARWIFLDVPVGEEPPDWRGYTGTHVLEVGWAGLHQSLAAAGFVPAHSSRGQIRSYKRI